METLEEQSLQIIGDAVYKFCKNRQIDNITKNIFINTLHADLYKLYKTQIDIIIKQKLAYADLYNEANDLLVKNKIKRPAIIIDPSRNA